MDYEFHEYANLFPLIEGQEFEELVADIRAHGVREPIWLYEGQVLDGRNRYRAGRVAGVDVPVVEYEGDDPLAMVVSLNLKRRHLNESQRAMVAARLATMRQGERTDITGISVMSQPVAAEMLRVSVDSLQNAKRVQAPGNAPELVKAVESGRVAVSAAAQATKFMTPEQQRVSVEDGTIAKAVAEHRRAEIKLREAEKVIAEAPKFTPEEAERIKEVMGAPGDGDIFSRIDEVIALLSEQPEPKEAALRIPEGLSHAVDVRKIHVAAQWLMDFCTAWAATREAPPFIPKFMVRETA